MPVTNGWNHVATLTTDMDLTIRFYEQPLDANEIIGDRRRQGGRGAIDHFALAVDSHATLEMVKERLAGAGGRRSARYSGWAMSGRGSFGTPTGLSSRSAVAPTVEVALGRHEGPGANAGWLWAR
jgi:hypothetical protein